MNFIDQFLADFDADRAARQQMFRAINFRRFGQHDGAALTHNFVGGHTQNRVSRHARPAIAAATLQRQPPIRRSARACVGQRSREGSNSFDGINPGLNRFADAAVFLNRERGRLEIVHRRGHNSPSNR